MNALSPNPYIFWATIAGPILIEAWQVEAVLGVEFVVGFYGALIGGFAGFVFLFAAVGGLSSGVSRLLNGMAAVALLLFGLYQLGVGIYSLVR